MLLKKWEALPTQMRTDEVRPYYEQLRKRQSSLLLKRLFDIAISALMLIILLPVFFILAIAIKLDSPGPVFYRQIRITQYGKVFKIFKFRTMVNNAEKIGTQVTVNNDSRVTRVGRFLRKYRLDELSQLIDVFRGTMTFVGTRPEVPRYVAAYNKEMMATLLLPAGITSEASIRYKDENRLLGESGNVDKTYISEVLPQKMKYNLSAIADFSLWAEVKTMLRTVLVVCGANFDEDI